MTTMSLHADAPAASERILSGELLALAAVVVAGTIMTILDATVVNVALATLGRSFGASIASIQWVSTIYLLAFASVIPLTGWAAQRFGARRVWLASLLVFMVGSLLAGLAWSLGALLVFRAVQGLGGGMVLPLGQTILAQAAGPHRMGRVMSIVGVPMLLAPIFGPVVGGALVGAASWRWIFLVNLPVGAAALLLALRLLPPTPPRPHERLDVRGLVLLSGGVASLAYGLAETGTRGAFAGAVPLTALALGLAAIALFVRHALRTSAPLVDVRLFASRAFATASATNFLLGAALFGMLVLLPLYFQLIRGESPLATGLLLIPQGVGAAVAMPLAGSLTDRIGASRVVPAGIGLALLGTAAYTQIGAATPYWYLAGALFLIGLGLGSTIMPSMAVGYRDLAREAVPRATSALNTTQRIAGSLGIALMAVVLQHAIAARLPRLDGGPAEAGALVARDPARNAPPLADAFGTTFWLALAIGLAALVPALLLPPAASRPTPDSTSPRG